MSSLTTSAIFSDILKLSKVIEAYDTENAKRTEQYSHALVLREKLLEKMIDRMSKENAV